MPDLIVIGGGIVGLATAYRFQQREPGRAVLLIEKERELAYHQSGRNSGVLHSGIYYKPGSHKAQNCREGKRQMEDFCREQEIPFEICGKVIVATSDEEVPRLHDILARGDANGVRCELVDARRLKELEPHAAGLAAIHVPETGIIDYSVVCERLAQLIRDAGGEILLGVRATGFATPAGNGEVVVQTTAGDYLGKQAVNCAGVYSDRVARLSGQTPAAQIVPFRGEYFELLPEARHLVRTLIYPVPDPSFPFLGVHFTKMIGGGVECGPNAVLAFSREGYHKLDVNLRDLVETLSYSGFLKLAAKYWKTGAGEMWRSLSKAAFVKALSRLAPEIRAEHLIPAPAGIRAQTVAPDGSMVDDFVIDSTDRVVNVLNAPSPAATSSLRIGEVIAERLAERF